MICPIYLQGDPPDNLICITVLYLPSVVIRLSHPIYRTDHLNGTVSIWGTINEKLPDKYQPYTVDNETLLQDLYTRGWIESTTTYAGNYYDIVEDEIDHLFEQE